MVCARRSRIEDDRDIIEARHFEQPVDAGRNRSDAKRGSTAQPFGCRVDPDQCGDLERGRKPPDLDHQIGADVARADDRALGPSGLCETHANDDSGNPANRVAVCRTWSRMACSARSSRSEEHTSELQSLMRISYAVFCLKKTKTNNTSATLPSG